MNSAYSYRYSAMPAEYYDYNYDVGTLSEVPGNYHKNNLMYQRQNKLPTRSSSAVAYNDYNDVIDRDGYGGGCYDEGVSIGLLLTTFLGIAIMGYTLYTKIKANGGKRKRSVLFSNAFFDPTSWFSLLPELVIKGK